MLSRKLLFTFLIFSLVWLKALACFQHQVSHHTFSEGNEAHQIFNNLKMYKEIKTLHDVTDKIFETNEMQLTHDTGPPRKMNSHGVAEEILPRNRKFVRSVSTERTVSLLTRSEKGLHHDLRGDGYPKNAMHKCNQTENSFSTRNPLKKLKRYRRRNETVAVLVLACNRVTVGRCLDLLFSYRPSERNFPIIVSQDGNDAATSEVIASYGARITFIKQPDQSVVPSLHPNFQGHGRVARHYHWALNKIFVHLHFETAIIVEDDLDVAPDFFEYFTATLPLLRRDPSLWCVSAWNDNGKSGYVDEQAPELLYRTDFFPGLGWLLTKEIWFELSPKWPIVFWDGWMREPEQRKGRACVRPELSRTYTFGKKGVSGGVNFDQHLRHIKLNTKFVPFTKIDLSYLIRKNYDSEFIQRVYNVSVITLKELISDEYPKPCSVRLLYYSRLSFLRTAVKLGIMSETFSGVPRTAYHGIVSFWRKGHRVYLAPPVNWKEYDASEK